MRTLLTRSAVLMTVALVLASSGCVVVTRGRGRSAPAPRRTHSVSGGVWVSAR